MRLRPQIGYLASTSLLNSLCDPTSLLNSLCSPTRILNSLRSPTRILNSLLNLIQIQKCTSINPSTLLHQYKITFSSKSLYFFLYCPPRRRLQCHVLANQTCHKNRWKTFHVCHDSFIWNMTHSCGTWLIHMEHASLPPTRGIIASGAMIHVPIHWYIMNDWFI